MENQPQAKRRREEEAAAGSMELEDRISQLPQNILHHHMLCFLPQKDAVRTCILSKSWRHLGPTRPKIEFHESSSLDSKEKFLFVAKNTLQRYHDQKLSIQEFILGVSVSVNDSERISLLDKWIPIVIMNSVYMKTFKLTALVDYYSLPSIVFQAEFLEELYLQGCKLDQINNCNVKLHMLKRLSLKYVISIEEETFEKIMSSCPLIQHLDLESCLQFDFPLPPVVFQAEFLEELFLKGCKLNQIKNFNVKLQRLKRLSLSCVSINEKTFEKIMSNCPLIQHLVLDSCYGLRTIKVNKVRNLKHFDCLSIRENKRIVIVDTPSLETIDIRNCQKWYHNNYFFPRLKSLFLWCVHLPTELLNNLSSNNCPCLQVLELRHCYGFSEFKLSNRSIKRLIINEPDRPIKASIDAANMLCFEFRTYYYFPSISFATTSRDCKSRIEVLGLSETMDDVLSTWSLELYEFLKSLSQSQISLGISYLPLTDYDGGSCEPVVVEHLFFRELYSSSQLPVLLNCLFRICRPRYIGLSLYSFSQKKHESQVAESIWNTLINKGETTQCLFWQQDLEESSIQVSDKNANEWRPVQICEFSNKEEIRFKLKWREDLS